MRGTFAASIELAQRLERAEAMANAASVDSRRLLEPEVGARWIEVAGLYAMFDGPDSPLTQTYGLGLFDPFGDAEFEQVETFFGELEAPTSHEVCAFADRDTLALLSTRGYSPIEASVVLVRDTASSVPSAASDIHVRPIAPDEAQLWASTSARGWSSDSPELASFVESLGAVIARTRGAVCFIAESRDAPIAAAAMHLVNGVALLAGASTVPEARRRGAQQALLRHRLAFAAERGIQLAMVVTQPGSASQRNAERGGFRPVYTRAKWQRTAR